VPKLHDVQFTKYTEKTIIISENVSGDEEVPVNCVCLVIVKSENYPDVLAHVSVRARNLNVPLAVCFNEKISDEVLKLLGQNLDVKIQNQEFIFTPNKGVKKEVKKEENAEEAEVKKVKVVDSGKEYKSIFVELDDFDKKCVGAKANNTKNVFGKVPGCDWLKYPESFAVPFNVHEYFLSLKENKEIKEEIDEYIEKIGKGIKADLIRNLLEKCKNLTKNINFVENPETLKLKKRLLQFGVKESEFDAAFKAIKTVWASKYNERAYIATSKVGITLDDIRMAVLCQKIIPAEYAYVIHTKNPSTNNENELFAEIVSGMGETLVGAYEGQSFSFAYNKTNGSYDIQSYPNKSISLRNSGYIFRSDSNTEDLEGFSGAGLFDSVPMVNDNEVEMAYHSDKLFNDKGFVDNAIKKVSSLGIGVEKLYGFPQDIEGVYYNGDFYIVQTRPQV
jgi:alpha-glucan,water dikinase